MCVNLIGLATEYTLFLWGPRHAQPHFIAYIQPKILHLEQLDSVVDIIKMHASKFREGIMNGCWTITAQVCNMPSGLL